MDLSVGSETFRLITIERAGQWTAHAVRAASGERFGIEVTASTEEDARSRLARWLEWQHEHTQALDALQQAERVYHRAMAGAAFASPEEGAGVESQASLDAVNEARHHLDEVRGRRPSV